MSFEFGIIHSIPLGKGTLSLLFVAFFLFLFEKITSAIDFLQDYYPSAYIMFQKLFKELMNIGIISFSIVMMQASGFLSSEGEWVIAVNFADVFFFLTALFLLVHALFLIIQALRLEVHYARDHFSNIKDVLEKIKNIESYSDRVLYEHQYLPGSCLKRTVEFKIINMLFRDTYSLPKSFDFSCYLKSYHEKYAIELVDIGFINWSILLMFSAGNYLIVSFSGVGYPCEPSDNNDDIKNLGQQRALSGSGSTMTKELASLRCNDLMLNYFVLAGFIMWTFCWCLLIFTRFCELR